MGIRLYQEVRLLILKKSPGGTFIPGGTSIRESRVISSKAFHEVKFLTISPTPYYCKFLSEMHVQLNE